MLVLDLAGAFAFGLTGGLVAVRARLDAYGVIVLAGVVGLAGGITRDILLGALPPATFSDWRYLSTVAAAGLVAFFAHSALGRLSKPVNIFDAAGLSLFCVTGTAKALAFDVGPVQAVLLGVITATGGGYAARRPGEGCPHGVPQGTVRRARPDRGGDFGRRFWLRPPRRGCSVHRRNSLLLSPHNRTALRSRLANRSGPARRSGWVNDKNVKQFVFKDQHSERA